MAGILRASICPNMAGLIKASLFGVGFVLVVVYVCFFIFFYFIVASHTRDTTRDGTRTSHPIWQRFCGFVSIDLESFFLDFLLRSF